MNKVLPSWRSTETREAILDFVEAVTAEGGPDYVSPEARVAVFDNDGTLWTEKPMPTQLHYLQQRWKLATEDDPALLERQPYQAAASGDITWLSTAIDKHYAGDDVDLGLLIAAVTGSSAGTSVDDYAASVADFYRDARHIGLGTPYSQVIYQPMVELIRYLEANGFTSYIVSGGDRDFMRPMTEAYYGIPAERVVGTGMGLTYDADANVVRYSPKLAFFDDGPEKPVRIWMRTGRHPILAAGGGIQQCRHRRQCPRRLVGGVPARDLMRDGTHRDQSRANAIAAS
jgi:phosphoserine phosphatase